MKRMPAFFARVRRLIWARRLDSDMRREMTGHFEEPVEGSLAQEPSQIKARQVAGEDFASRVPVEEAHREARSFFSIDHLFRDVRHGARALRRNAGFSLLVLFVLAIGTGAVTAVFVLLNRIVLQPLSFPDSDQLVVIRHSAPGMNLNEVGLSSGLYFHYSQQVRSLESIGVYSEGLLNLRVPDSGAGTERVHVTYAGAAVFRVLRATPALGRLFTEDDGRPGFMSMRWTIPILLAHDLWVSRFGRDLNVIGRIVTINDNPRIVVGVMPDEFVFPDTRTKIWMLMEPSRVSANFAQDFGWNAVARLRPGETRLSARSELEHVLPQIEGLYKDATPQRIAEVRIRPIVTPLKNAVIGDVGGVLWTVLGGMGLMLVIAGFNAASLFAARAEQRRGEVAVRQALGAHRYHVARLFVTEAFLLSSIAAGLGLLIARALVAAVIAFAPIELPRAREIELDGVAVVFAAALALVATAAYGILSLRGQGASVTGRLLRSGDHRITGYRSRHWGNDPFIVPQVALAISLVVGSALMVKTYQNLAQTALGFQPEHLLTVEVGLPGRKASQHVRIYRDAVENIGRVPGVDRVSAASFAPLTSSEHVLPVERGATPIPFKFFVPGYFQTIGASITDGASLALDERVNTRYPVVVSAALARRLFPADTAVGKIIQRLNEDGSVTELKEGPVPPFTIVGVVGDIKESSLRRTNQEVVYVPVIEPRVEQSIVPTNMVLMIRSQVPPLSVMAAVKAAIEAADPALSVGQVRTMDTIVRAARARETFVGTLLVVAAVISLVIGVVAVYGSVTHVVSRRTREIGIRIALGAQRAQVIRMVAMGSMRAILIGTAMGIGMTLVGTRLLESLLFGVEPRDPAMLLISTAIVMAVAFGSALVASRRAIGPAPLIAIQSD